MKRTTAVISGLLLGAMMLSGCAGQTGEPSADTVSASGTQNPNGWYCEELLYNRFASEDKLRFINDPGSALAALDPLKSAPLNLTDDMTLTGFFLQDVSLRPADADDYSDPAVKDKAYSEAAYGDTWYFDLSDPEKYLSLPAQYMPSYIRIGYAPDGSIIVNEREAIIISLCYLPEDGGTSSTEAFAYTWFRGPEQTGGS